MLRSVVLSEVSVNTAQTKVKLSDISLVAFDQKSRLLEHFLNKFVNVLTILWLQNHGLRKRK